MGEPRAAVSRYSGTVRRLLASQALVMFILTITIPFTHVTLYSTPMVEFMTPFMAAFLGLALNEGAYIAEIVRAGILSVDEGQV